MIAIRNARANNLKSVDVDIPKGQLTVVTGVSGSGKSSLVGNVLQTEARRRYLESLSMYERQGLREGADAPVDSITGLGVTLTVAAQQAHTWSQTPAIYATEQCRGDHRDQFSSCEPDGVAGRTRLPGLWDQNGASRGMDLPEL